MLSLTSSPSRPSLTFATVLAKDAGDPPTLPASPRFVVVVIKFFVPRPQFSSSHFDLLGQFLFSLHLLCSRQEDGAFTHRHRELGRACLPCGCRQTALGSRKAWMHFVLCITTRLVVATACCALHLGAISRRRRRLQTESGDSQLLSPMACMHTVDSPCSLLALNMSSLQSRCARLQTQALHLQQAPENVWPGSTTSRNPGTVVITVSALRRSDGVTCRYRHKLTAKDCLLDNLWHTDFIQ